MGKEISILLVGIGGYGRHYVDALLNYSGRENIKIAGVVDPKPEGYRNLNMIKEMKVPIFNSIEDFYEHLYAGLAIISSPINYHCQQTCYALSKGSNVLCEKPVSATVQDAFKMLQAKEKSGKFVGIGFQWSYTKAIQNLKRDIMNGVLGKPLRLKTIVLWPRDENYFRRGWAGKKRNGRGNWILDSVANNATAHYLHNMLYVLGEEEDRSACPGSVTAELYRANKIENYDTAAIRVYTKNEAEILFIASHAVDEQIAPKFIFEFEKARVEYESEDGSGEIKALFNDGIVKNYGSPNEEHIIKLRTVLDCLNGRGTIPCGIEASIPHITCINGAQESMKEIGTFPENIINKDKSTKVTYVKGLSDVLKDCYRDWKLPSEEGIGWAKKGKPVNLIGYKYFSGDGI